MVLYSEVIYDHRGGGRQDFGRLDAITSILWDRVDVGAERIVNLPVCFLVRREGGGTW